MEKKTEVLSILVADNYGVLTRISNLVTRRGYNIDTLTVSTTDNPKISRITMTVKGNHHEIEHIIAQTIKLEEVLNAEILEPSKSVLREITLIKVKADANTRGHIKEAADIYSACVVDLSPKSMIVELTGRPSKIDAFIKIMEEFGVIEMCRTSATAMQRNSVAYKNKER